MPPPKRKKKTQPKNFKYCDRCEEWGHSANENKCPEDKQPLLPKGKKIQIIPAVIKKTIERRKQRNKEYWEGLPERSRLREEFLLSLDFNSRHYSDSDNNNSCEETVNELDINELNESVSAVSVNMNDEDDGDENVTENTDDYENSVQETCEEEQNEYPYQRYSSNNASEIEEANESASAMSVPNSNDNEEYDDEENYYYGNNDEEEDDGEEGVSAYGENYESNPSEEDAICRTCKKTGHTSGFCKGKAIALPLRTPEPPSNDDSLSDEGYNPNCPMNVSQGYNPNNPENVRTSNIYRPSTSRTNFVAGVSPQKRSANKGVCSNQKKSTSRLPSKVSLLGKFKKFLSGKSKKSSSRKGVQPVSEHSCTEDNYSERSCLEQESMSPLSPRDSSRPQLRNVPVRNERGRFAKSKSFLGLYILIHKLPLVINERIVNEVKLLINVLLQEQKNQLPLCHL